MAAPLPFTYAPLACYSYEPVASWSVTAPTWRDEVASLSPPTMPMSPLTRSLEVELAPQVEEQFFRDFSCCGLCLKDLHAVIRHQQTHHFGMRQQTLEDMPAMIHGLSGRILETPQLLSVAPSASFGVTPSAFPYSVPGPAAISPVPSFSPPAPFHPAYQLPPSEPMQQQPMPQAFQPAPPSPVQLLELEASLDVSNYPSPNPSLSSVSSSSSSPLTPSLPDLHPLSLSGLSLEPNHVFMPGYYTPFQNSPESSPSPPPHLPRKKHSLSRVNSVSMLSAKRHRGVDSEEDGVPKPRRNKATRNRGPLNYSKYEGRVIYKCPKPGCVKIYLNPNGLKYHLTKGTCDFDGTKPTFDKGFEPED